MLLIGFFFVTNSIAQTKLSTGNSQRPDNPVGEDTSAVRRAKGFKNVATIDMYLQYNKELDTSLVDTTLVIDKYYKFRAPIIRNIEFFCLELYLHII